MLSLIHTICFSLQDVCIYFVSFRKIYFKNSLSLSFIGHFYSITRLQDKTETLSESVFSGSQITEWYRKKSTLVAVFPNKSGQITQLYRKKFRSILRLVCNEQNNFFTIYTSEEATFWTICIPRVGLYLSTVDESFI